MVPLRIQPPPLSFHFLPKTSLTPPHLSPPSTGSNGGTGAGTGTPTRCSRRRSRSGCKAAENDPTQFEIDQERAREALEKLDQQLQTLSQEQTLTPKKKELNPSTSSYSDSKVDMTTKDMPEFSGSFLAYSAVVLLIITFITNLVFILVIKPSVDGN